MTPNEILHSRHRIIHAPAWRDTWITAGMPNFLRDGTPCRDIRNSIAWQSVGFKGWGFAVRGSL